MIIAFDLDDTLYPEQSFVLSGFAAVCELLEKEHGIPAVQSLAIMTQRLSHGRDLIMDDTLTALHLHSTSLVRRCVGAYRNHKPKLCLEPAADRCLRRFAHLPLYIVTDGNRRVQRNKLRALGLESRVKRCFVTHEHGVRHAKPSPHCFLKICELEGAQPHDVVYVGDNPHKDFIGIKPLGFRTLRLRSGRFRDLTLDRKREAESEIHSLDELTTHRLQALFSSRTSASSTANSSAPCLKGSLNTH